MAKVISKDKVDAFFGKLSGMEVYGPVEEDGIVLYKKVTGTPSLDFSNSKKPPKDVLFPQTEKMLDLVRDGPRFVDTKEPEMPDTPIVLFGVRPCYAAAISTLDKLFTWDYNDPYYVDPLRHPPISSNTAFYPRNMPVVFPNPFNPVTAKDGRLKFDNLIYGANIYVFTLSAEIVISLDATSIRMEWDGTNRYGQKISPGIYYYIIDLGEKKVKGKLFVVKDE